MEKGAKKADNKKRMRRTALKRPGGESSVKRNAQEGEKRAGRPARDNERASWQRIVAADECYHRALRFRL